MSDMSIIDFSFMETEKQKIGNLGEGIACQFLIKQGFKIKDRNYRKKWGEIDIIAEKEGLLRFIEVKTVSSYYQNYGMQVKEIGYHPEDNVHLWKRKRLARAIQTYLLEKKVSDETEWQFDVLAIVLDFKTRKAKIRTIENVIL